MTALLVTSISALFLQSTLFTEYVGPKLKAAYKHLLHALDVFAESSMRHAVPERQLRKAPRGVKRSRSARR